MIIKLDFELKAITRETIFYENILFLYLQKSKYEYVQYFTHRNKV